MNENEMLKGIKEGKTSAFESLYKSYYPMVLQYVLNNSGKSEDAEDLFQETLLALVKNVRKPSFDLSSKIGTYIHAIAKNKWLYRLRGNKKTRVVSLDKYEGMEVAEEELIEDPFNDRHKLVSKVFGEISEDCKSLLLGFYYQKKKLSDIAKEMDWTANFIKVKKHRCMASLKTKVTGHPDYQTL